MGRAASIWEGQEREESKVTLKLNGTKSEWIRKNDGMKRYAKFLAVKTKMYSISGTPKCISTNFNEAFCMK